MSQSRVRVRSEEWEVRRRCVSRGLAVRECGAWGDREGDGIGFWGEWERGPLAGQGQQRADTGPPLNFGPCRARGAAQARPAASGRASPGPHVTGPGRARAGLKNGLRAMPSRRASGCMNMHEHLYSHAYFPTRMETNHFPSKCKPPITIGFNNQQFRNSFTCSRHHKGKNTISTRES